LKSLYNDIVFRVGSMIISRFVEESIVMLLAFLGTMTLHILV
jgi:hypothetical protein